MPRAGTRPILRITHRPGEGDSHNVTVELTRGPKRLEFSRTFDFAVSEEERERIQWYLETYLEYPEDPAPALAHTAEQAMADIGTRLFEAVFEGDRDAERLWGRLEPILPGTRVEVAGELETGWPIPWELLRDPGTEEWLAIRTAEFVRTHPGPVRPADIPSRVKPPIRILLAICRPEREKDVAYRSVARPLVAALGSREDFQLHVLRPPTYDELAKRLREATADGEPYHILHFDGHGDFLDMWELFAQSEGKAHDERARLLASVIDTDPARFSLPALYPAQPRAGQRGYLRFEKPDSEVNVRFVDGPQLGALLAETGVLLLVLNACRSGRAAEHSDGPQPTPDGEEPYRHERVRAFASLGQEIMDAGVAGVLAMRYNVYVVTAALFMGALYDRLVKGDAFGAAASAARKALNAAPLRDVGYGDTRLDDWIVPAVYEAAPIHLFPKRRRVAKKEQQVVVRPQASTPGRAVDIGIPPPPDHGFWGRDETLLALDRAFDGHQIVLLHGFAGSGKTAAAAEFGRWYGLTGGAERVLFTSFERHRPLQQALGIIEQAFGPALESQGVHWLTLEEDERWRVALQLFEQVPVLWIWDNVEPITGFPAGGESAWSDHEQAELLEFLRDLNNNTQSRVLLTSRRDEEAWLGDLPCRVPLPRMPMSDRIQLAHALAKKHRRPLANVRDWLPLLGFTQGNPLTITAVAGQALRDGLKTSDEIERFVAALRAGKAAFQDEQAEGRSRSLGASLSYGFEHAFTEDERKQLALLHLFQGFVNVGVLRAMGAPDEDWCVPAVRGLSREAAIALLDRAGEVGLLTAHGADYYAIHPALPWYFEKLFQAFHGDCETAVTRAFVSAIGALAEHYHGQYQEGNRDVVAALGAEEPNLLRARDLARAHEWWGPVIQTTHSLQQLYRHTGRWADWAMLAQEIIPDFVDPASDGPLPGREHLWRIVISYRVTLAGRARRWAEAERLQQRLVDSARQGAAVALSPPQPTCAPEERQAIRTLAVMLHELAQIQREQGRPECVDPYSEALELSQRIGDQAAAATCALNLGNAYKDLPDLRDLGAAEQWYRRSMELFPEGDRQGRAYCHGQLAAVAHERFRQARARKRPAEELLTHLNDAAHGYHRALELLPADAVEDLGTAHAQLGGIYGDAGDMERAMRHSLESIRLRELASDTHGAGLTRHNLALHLTVARQLRDALQYARAALRDFEACRPAAEDMVRKTEDLIARIQRDISAAGA